MDVSKKFKDLRTAKDFSIYRLSKAADVSENYIRTIEKGDSQPSVFILDKLLTSMGITLAEFFNESNDVLYPTPFERELVESTRILNDEKAAAVLQLVKLLSM